MNKKGFVNIVFIILAVGLATALGYLALVKKPVPAEVKQNLSANQPQTDTPKIAQPTPTPTAPIKTPAPSPTPQAANTPKNQTPAKAPATNTITSCISIKASGDYTLSADISADGIACIQVNNVSLVSIDCGGHKVFGNPALESINSSHIKIKSCFFDSSVIEFPSITFKNGKDLDISNSTFNQNKLDRAFVDIEDSSGISFTDNTVYGTYSQSFSSQAEIKNNNFILFPFAKGAAGAGITLTYGSFNKIENNTIDGAAAGKFNTQIGADDGITLMDESHDFISGNKIQNVWDCGIETAGTIQSSTFSNNSTKNSGICGIGGWYWSSLKDNIFQNNIIDDAKQAFVFLRNYGLRAARKESGHDEDADTVVYFQNNQFIGNTFINPRPIHDYSSDFHIVPVSISSLSKIPGEKPITDSDIVAGNNTFTGNNFGAGVAPLIWPVSLGIDGGGNRCGALNPDWPPETSDFTNRYKDNPYPLKCQ